MEDTQRGPRRLRADKARGSFDGGQAIRAAGNASGVGAGAGEADQGLLDELRALQVGLFDGWLSEAQLRRLADAAYRTPPAAVQPALRDAAEPIELSPDPRVDRRRPVKGRA